MLFILLSLLVSDSYAKEPIKIAVIDTGLDLTDPRFAGKLCATGHKDFTNTTLQDNIGHGTHVAGLIEKNAGNSNYCMIILKYYLEERVNDTLNTFRTILAFNEAENLGADIVNFSSGGPNFIDIEYQTIKTSKALFVLAAGNDHADVRNNFYPAAYHLPNSLVIGSLDRKGNKAKFSNFGPFVDVWELGEDLLSYLPGNMNGIFSGTSMSAAIEAGKLLNNSLETLDQIRHICVRTRSNLRLCSRSP